MPRKLRIMFPNAWYHAMNRGLLDVMLSNLTNINLNLYYFYAYKIKEITTCVRKLLGVVA